MLTQDACEKLEGTKMILPTYPLVQKEVWRGDTETW